HQPHFVINQSSSGKGETMKSGIIVLLAVAMGLLCGQGERGTFNGTIVDPTGAAVSAANVQAVNTATNVETAVLTTDAGVFRIPYLQPGTYRLTVSASIASAQSSGGPVG